MKKNSTEKKISLEDLDDEFLEILAEEDDYRKRVDYKFQACLELIKRLHDFVNYESGKSINKSLDKRTSNKDGKRKAS